MTMIVNKPQFDTQKLSVGRAMMIQSRHSSVLGSGMKMDVSFGIIRYSSPLKVVLLCVDGKSAKDVVVRIEDIVNKSYILSILEPTESIGD